MRKRRPELVVAVRPGYKRSRSIPANAGSVSQRSPDDGAAAQPGHCLGRDSFPRASFPSPAESPADPTGGADLGSAYASSRDRKLTTPLDRQASTARLTWLASAFEGREPT